MEKYLKAQTLPPTCFENNGEYVLPDYQGDVKKILSQEAVYVPAGKYRQDGNLEVSGTVHFRVLYLDTEGKLTSAEFPMDFEGSLPERSDEVSDAFPDPVLTNYLVRSVGPRKFSVRYTVCVMGSEQMPGGLAGGEDFPTDGTAEILKKSVSERAQKHGTSDEREFAGEMTRLEETDPESVDVMQTSGNVLIEESFAEADGIRVKGKMILSALIGSRDANGLPPFVTVHEIPFEEVIPVDGVLPGEETTAKGVCTSVTAHAAGGENGECVITVDAIAEFSGEANTNLQRQIPVDAYATGVPCTVETEEYVFEEFAGCVSCPLTLKVTEPDKAEDRPEFRQIVSTSAQVKVKSVSAVSGGLRIEGETAVAVVGTVAAEEDGFRFAVRKFTSPFDETVRADVRAEERTKVQLSLTPVSAAALLDGETLTGTVECALCATAVNPKTVSAVVKLIPGEPENGEAHVIRVVYPEPGETLWSLGKKYRKPLAVLAAGNDLSVPASAGADTPLGDKEIYIF